MSYGIRTHFRLRRWTGLGSAMLLLWITTLSVGCAHSGEVSGSASRGDDGGVLASSPLLAAQVQTDGTAGTTVQATQPSELPWTIVADGWVYIMGDKPSLSMDSVTAAAEGSTIILYRFTKAGDHVVRCILVETHGKGPGKVKKKKHDGNDTPDKNFKSGTASYIDVHVDTDVIDEPQDFTMPTDFSAAKPNALDQELWDQLLNVDAGLKKYGVQWGHGTVGS